MMSAKSTPCRRAWYPQVLRRLWEALQPGGELAAGALVELDFKPFMIEAVHRAPCDHPWAAQDNYKDLAAACLVQPEAPPRRLSLQLASPTTFHTRQRHMPLPLPELLFGALLERWNAFAPLAFPGEARRYARECLAVSRYSLRTRAVQLRENAVRIGAVGRVTYSTLNYDRYWMSVLHTLAAFALYCGAGVSASMGLGQCRALASEAAVPHGQEKEGQDG